MSKAKELTKNPFKMKNKLDQETTVIQKIIDRVEKNEIESDKAIELQNEFEKLLKATKDPIQCWVRANVLDNMKMPVMALLFKAKAMELGYIVESVYDQEGFVYGTVGRVSLKNVQGWIYEQWDPDVLRDNFKHVFNIRQVDPNLMKEKLWNYFQGKPTPEHVDYCFGGILQEGYEHMDWKPDRLSSDYKMRMSAINAQFGEQFDTLLTDVCKMLASSDNIFAVKHEAQSYHILLGMTMEYVENWFIGHSMGIINTTLKTDMDDVQENHKQKFEYSPSEELKPRIAVVEDAEVPRFNTAALRNMIDSDAFLKFSYGQLFNGSDEETLDKIFDTYIKGEEDMEKKLKEFDSYTYKMTESYKPVDNGIKRIF